MEGLRLGRSLCDLRRCAPENNQNFDHGWVTARVGKERAKANQLGVRDCFSRALPIRAETIDQPDMNATETQPAIGELPLPESHRDLELLLQALHALNDALDQYEVEDAAKS
jgi:hypothetical protein